MIKSNLSKVLKRQKLSIRELAGKTNINRASLTQLVNNDSKMIKFSTLNRIIKNLNVSISDILEFVPDINLVFEYNVINSKKKVIAIKATFTDTDLNKNQTAKFQVTLKRTDNIVSITVTGDPREINKLKNNVDHLSSNNRKRENMPDSDTAKAKIALQPFSTQLLLYLLKQSEIKELVNITSMPNQAVDIVNLIFVFDFLIPASNSEAGNITLSIDGVNLATQFLA